MEFSTDPYEYKLYQMFQSCDTNQCGYLDENSLRRLCAQLELRDKGAVLIENLAREERTSHVTFENFKEALLNFLGTEIDGANSNSDITNDYQRKEQTTKVNSESDKACGELTLVISAGEETFAIDSATELSDREVLPKLVVGTKKYGRRSRPQTQKQSADHSASDSDDSIYEQDSPSHRGCGIQQQVKRSTSQNDIPGSRRRTTASATESKLKRCASLPAQRNIFNQGKSKLVANKSGNLTKDTLMPITKNTLSSSVESLADSPGLMETLPVNSILDLWERSSIPNGRGILLALGFDSDEINVAQLNKVMEEEISNLEEEPQTALMKACLALQSEELNNLRQFSKQQRDENAKIRADNKDANRRIALLAAEIDERHASLEDATKRELRLLEQRHAGVVRDLTARLANDRENWSSLNSRLEAKLKQFEQDEVKWKAEYEMVRQENTELESDKQKMQKQITELLEKNIGLQTELTEMDETNHCRMSKQFEKSNNEEEVLRLVEKVGALQMENCSLRDKNDELVAEVESLNHELNKTKMKLKKLTLSQEMNDVDENEMSSSSAAVKRRGDSPSKTRLIEESPRLGKLRKCTNDSHNTCSENSDTSGEWMPLNSELHNLQTKSSTSNQQQQQLEIETLKKRIAELEEQLKQAKEKSQSPTTSTMSASNEERCKELEASLEQMQKAYEDCEDYWQAKLTEERTLFEKERQIYEEEQQESDKKFTELMEKVREYEEQFSKDGRLSPIEEKDVLEQQYADLEAEAEEIRENARKIFEEKSQEIEALQAEIEDLKARLGESVEILTGAYELKAETANSNLTGNGSAANSPINYLWQQSTIQEPSKNCQPLDMNFITLGGILPMNQQTPRVNLSTSETTIFSTTLQTQAVLSPIAKPISQTQTQSTHSEAGDVADCETSSTASGKSFETHSIHSNHSYQQRNNQTLSKTIISTKNNSPSPTPSILKDELKRLKYFEISLKEQIKDLSLQRDGLIMELQQLQEAKPVLEKAYARTCHPSLIQRVNQLELKNRHLQNVVKQQQKHTETLMQQSWCHHQIELNDLYGRLEAQGAVIAEQVQRLQNADILVKDLYVENSHLNASVQRLEQQRLRVNMLQQQHRQSCGTVPGIP